MQPSTKQNVLTPIRLAQKFTISEIPGLRHTQQVVLGPKGFVPVHSIEIDAIELDSLSPESATELFGQIRSIIERARKESRS
jgi:hypothetical protein